MMFRSYEMIDLWSRARSAQAAATEGAEYSLAVFNFAQRWADAVESALSNGADLSLSLVLSLADQADTEGVSAWQFQTAGNMLRKVWLHGDVFFAEEDFGD